MLAVPTNVLVGPRVGPGHRWFRPNVSAPGRPSPSGRPISWPISVSQGGPPGASTINHHLEWAAPAGRPTVQDVGVDRGGRDVQVPEQIPERSRYCGRFRRDGCRPWRCAGAPDSWRSWRPRGPVIGSARATTTALRGRGAATRSRRVGTIWLLCSWSSPARNAGWPCRLPSAVPTRLHGETRLRRALRRREDALPSLTAPPSPGAEQGEGFLVHGPTRAERRRGRADDEPCRAQPYQKHSPCFTWRARRRASGAGSSPGGQRDAAAGTRLGTEMGAGPGMLR
jgi:hypothetical protein